MASPQTPKSGDFELYVTAVSPFEDLRVSRPGAVRTSHKRVARPTTTLDPIYASDITTVFNELKTVHTSLTGKKTNLTDAGRVKIQRLIKGSETFPPLPATGLVAVNQWTSEHRFWSGKIINVDGLHRHAKKIFVDREFREWYATRSPASEQSEIDNDTGLEIIQA